MSVGERGGVEGPEYQESEAKGFVDRDGDETEEEEEDETDVDANDEDEAEEEEGVSGRSRPECTREAANVSDVIGVRSIARSSASMGLCAHTRETAARGSFMPPHARLSRSCSVSLAPLTRPVIALKRLEPDDGAEEADVGAI